MTLKIGAKLICPQCQSEFIITKLSNDAALKCCGEKVGLKQAGK